ncbi:GNAT family N-acetyltransferase [Pseudomonas fontis]|uniref:GNAT family N-acetyltransferase n=1 Tax=Pseudomonas fontis TaxID=2942633 RepID=A0ABT5P0N4_9PSED|nr:GNAT family N-acetyltransferase [Pseudomonas fontis]MDD0972818.1 GNAT family N-acetyltransferase [Pseudomonas fontis]MDD0993970.1 GNAT family N-acetyltransferase [Pseudomonas fontis]
MSQIRASALTPPERPLLNKFYRSLASPMRASAQGQLWVARAEAIVAALSLTPVPGGHWLTSLLVDPAWRGRGVARQLIAQACIDKLGCIWLFCHPDLEGFYAAQGFERTETLPPVLAERLARYQRSKPLLALARAQSSEEGSSPGNNTSV